MKRSISYLMPLFIILVSFIFGCETFCGKCYCDNMDAQNLPLKDTFQMKFGETYCNPENRFTLTFDSIHEGRCPTGVFCVWEGNAQVFFTLNSKNEGTSEFILNTAGGLLTDTTIHSLRFELLNLDPYPHVDVEYPQEVYTASVLISE